MKYVLIGLLVSASTICILKCTGEHFGRRLDPDYDNYINDRTLQQKIQDDNQIEKIQPDRKARQNTYEAEKRLNLKLDSISRAEKEKANDSLK